MLHAVPSGTIHHPALVPRGAGTALVCHGQLVAPGSQNSRCGHNSSPPKPSEALESSRERDRDMGLCSPKSYFRIPQTPIFPLISTNPNRTQPRPHFFPFIPPNPKQTAEMKHFWIERNGIFPVGRDLHASPPHSPPNRPKQRMSREPVPSKASPELPKIK